MSSSSVCLICGSKEFGEHCEATDSLVSEEKFRLLKCNHCGFVFTYDPPEEDEINQYYLSEDYISHADRKSSLFDIIYHLVRGHMIRKKYNLTTVICRKNRGTILDVGSGTGYFASFMQKKEWDATGVEISERARNYSVSKFGIKVISPEKVKGLAERSFDCITLWHVLEHFHDPVAWLSEIHRLLKDDGKCILAVPNIISEDAKWFGSDWAALDVPRHLWHFEPETLIRLTQNNGLRCTRIKGMPLDLFYISILSYKNLKKNLALIRGLFTAAFLFFKGIFKKNSSSSLIFILEKEKV